jgi:hypothetical protein
MEGRRQFLIGASAALGGLAATGAENPAFAQTGYSTSVKVWNLEGGSGMNVTARLWMLWDVLGTGSGSGPQAMDEGDDAHTNVISSFNISFAQGPSFQAVSTDRGIGVSLQDTALMGANTGWWFRSGRFDPTLPTDSIEVILAPANNIPPAQINTMLPAVPFTADAGTKTTVTSLTVVLVDPTPGSGFSGGFITLIAGGTTQPSPLPVPVGFTYSLSFQVVPSASIESAATLSLEIASPTRGNITFTGTGSIVSAAEASILNVLNRVAINMVFPLFRDRLQTAINAGAISNAASVLGSQNGTLPQGVILSVRTVQTRLTASPNLMPGITVRAALGAYGGVVSKFPKPVVSGPTSCFIATAATGADSGEVAVLQRLRDEHLVRFTFGRRFVALYARLSPPLADVIRRNEILRKWVRRLVVGPAAAIARRIVKKDHCAG